MMGYTWCTDPTNPHDSDIIRAITGEERPPTSRYVYQDAEPTRDEAERLCKEFQLLRQEVSLKPK